MRKVITYGTYDLLHEGHVNLLRRAKELGDYLIVGVTSEDFDRSRGKINVQQSLAERMRAVQSTGFADLVVPEEYLGQKIDDIRRYGIDVFTVGSDWTGHFDYLKEYCEVVYLDRTEGVSSTELRAVGNHMCLGIVGNTPEAKKFVSEAQYVSGVEIVGSCSFGSLEDAGQVLSSAPGFDGIDALLKVSDAVYVACSPSDRASAARRALEAGKHVVCESPIAMSEEEARMLFRLARENGVVLFEAIKTAYALAFSRLTLLAKSNHVGTVRSVRATCTSIRDGDLGSFEDWGPIAALPVFSILGTDYLDSSCTTWMSNDGRRDLYTKIDLVFPAAVGTIEVGNGVKSEGDLVVSGTEGYIYVPAPWWKTEYFEIRREDLATTKRYFYQLDGEGIRNEIAAFSHAVNHPDDHVSSISEETTIALSKLMESFAFSHMKTSFIS